MRQDVWRKLGPGVYRGECEYTTAPRGFPNDCPKRARWMSPTGRRLCGEHAQAIKVLFGDDKEKR